MHADVAMWAAFGSLFTAISTLGTAGFAYLSLLAKNRQQDQRIRTLEIDHNKCEEERARLCADRDLEWPSDATELMQAMQALRANGIPATMREVTMILAARKKRIILPGGA